MDCGARRSPGVWESRTFDEGKRSKCLRSNLYKLIRGSYARCLRPSFFSKSNLIRRNHHHHATDAFRKVKATSEMAPQTGDNFLQKHRQPTEVSRERATVCDRGNSISSLFSSRQWHWSLPKHATDRVVNERQGDTKPPLGRPRNSLPCWRTLRCLSLVLPWSKLL